MVYAPRNYDVLKLLCATCVTFYINNIRTRTNNLCPEAYVGTVHVSQFGITLSMKPHSKHRWHCTEAAPIPVLKRIVVATRPLECKMMQPRRSGNACSRSSARRMNAMLTCGGLVKINCHCQLSKLVGDKFPRTRSLARPVEATRSHDLHPRPASDTAIRNIAKATY